MGGSPRSMSRLTRRWRGSATCTSTGTTRRSSGPFGSGSILPTRAPRLRWRPRAAARSPEKSKKTCAVGRNSTEGARSTYVWHHADLGEERPEQNWASLVVWLAVEIVREAVFDPFRGLVGDAGTAGKRQGPPPPQPPPPQPPCPPPQPPWPPP